MDLFLIEKFSWEKDDGDDDDLAEPSTLLHVDEVVAVVDNDPGGLNNLEVDDGNENAVADETWSKEMIAIHVLTIVLIVVILDGSVTIVVLCDDSYKQR